MATNWYDPSGSSAGFYNSPQDFLFKSSGGTWYGQGPAGQSDASAMPTAGEYYFGGGGAQPSAAPTPSFAPMGGGGPVTPQGWNPHPNVRGGGVSITQDYNAPVPVGAGPLWSRYQSVQANPAALTADPAYQFAFNQGMEALNRTAGARRMRFAGKTMLDAQNFGQGLAAQNFRTMLGELRAGAQDEYTRDLQNARANALTNANKLMAADPYGHLRKAMEFNNPYSYAASLGVQDPNAYSTLEARWMAARDLKKRMGL